MKRISTATKEIIITQLREGVSVAEILTKTDISRSSIY